MKTRLTYIALSGLALVALLGPSASARKASGVFTGVYRARDDLDRPLRLRNCDPRLLHRAERPEPQWAECHRTRPADRRVTGVSTAARN